MAELFTKWLLIDPTSLKDNGSGELHVKLVSVPDTGQIPSVEATTNGLQVILGALTNDHINASAGIETSKLADGAKIMLNDKNEPNIVADWVFNVANIPMIGTEHITTKEYVDALLQGLSPKDAVRAMSTANLAITGVPGSDVDGVTMVADDRILLTGQTNAVQNGIWVIKTGAWVRPDDFAAGSSVGSAYTFVQEGDTYADTGWVCTNDIGSDVVDTDALAWVQFSRAGVIVPGNGLEKVGNTFNVVPAELVKGGNAEIDGDKLQVNYSPTYFTPVTGAGHPSADQLGSMLAGIDAALSSVGESQVERFTLTATHITNKGVTLANTPKTANRVTLTVRGGPAQQYGDDFVMKVSPNENDLSWDSTLGVDTNLENTLEVGDRITVRYDI